MCGIAGIASRAPIGWHPVHLLAHRGPDGQDEVAIDLRAGHVVLCHSRLAIVDLSHAGDQPMANEDGSLLMVFNGEIYNHEELRSRCIAAGHTFRSRMDGEVILHLWEMEGPACLNRLNGIFAVAIVDTRTSQVYLARDPLGVKPLFATEAEDGTLRFASEIAGLWELGAERGPLDVTALAQFLTFLWIPDPRTPYANVRSVEPGTYVRWHPIDGSRHHRYHRLEDEVDVERPPRDFATAMTELRSVLGAAVGRQLLGDVPIGVMASGGVDSSLIWSMAGENVGRAYTIQWDASGQDGLGEDADAVRLLEASIGTPVRYLPGSDAGVNSLPLGGDLFADPAFELTRFIAAAARDDRYKVLLSGQGGDEVFGGYRRHAVAAMLGFASIGGSGRAAAAALSRFGAGAHVEFAARLARALSRRDPMERYMELCSYSSAAERARALGVDTAEVTDQVVWQRHRQIWDRLPPSLSYLRRAMALDLGVYLPGLGLGYVDRAGMEFGVEIRVPWLDLELIRWSFTLRDDLLVRRMSGKLLPKALARTVIPPAVVDRPKRGFGVPTGSLETTKQTGSRGFRQGQYFANATAVLDDWMQNDRHMNPQLST